jgi:hypothetical protein
MKLNDQEEKSFVLVALLVQSLVLLQTTKIRNSPSSTSQFRIDGTSEAIDCFTGRQQ